MAARKVVFIPVRLSEIELWDVTATEESVKAIIGTPALLRILEDGIGQEMAAMHDRLRALREKRNARRRGRNTL